MASKRWSSVAMIAIVTMAVLFIGSADANCKDGYKSCGDKHHHSCETDIYNDVYNCGDCGKKCDEYAHSKPICYYGKCDIKCDDGWKDCNDKKYDGCEVDVKSDDYNCGSCGYECGYGEKCMDFKCKCKPGWKDCNKTGKCDVDTNNDVNNCGGCGYKCEQPKYYGGEAVCRKGSVRSNARRG